MINSKDNEACLSAQYIAIKDLNTALLRKNNDRKTEISIVFSMSNKNKYRSSKKIDLKK